MEIVKTVRGRVEQTYDSETGRCTFQEFVLDDDPCVTYEDSDGSTIDKPGSLIWYPYEMEQPDCKILDENAEEEDE